MHQSVQKDEILKIIHDKIIKFFKMRLVHEYRNSNGGSNSGLLFDTKSGEKYCIDVDQSYSKSHPDNAKLLVIHDLKKLFDSHGLDNGIFISNITPMEVSVGAIDEENLISSNLNELKSTWSINDFETFSNNFEKIEIIIKLKADDADCGLK